MHPRQIPAALALLAALCVAGCGVDDAKPAPAIDEDQWGQLPPDPDRPQQAEVSPAAPKS